MLIFTASSPEVDVRFSFDMNATLNSRELSSLFDTFAQDVQGMGSLPNIDNNPMENTMNDSLFGFMNDTYHSEQMGWT